MTFVVVVRCVLCVGCCVLRVACFFKKTFRCCECVRVVCGFFGCLVVACCLLLVGCGLCLMFVVRCVLLCVARCVLLVVGCCSLVVGRWLF